MPNPSGYPETLRAPQPGNTCALKHGIFSRTGRILHPRAKEIAETVTGAPFVTDIDEIGIQEIASLLATLEAIDAELATGLVRRGRDKIKLLQMRSAFSRRLQEWLGAYGWT